jgi:hypothetical protein
MLTLPPFPHPPLSNLKDWLNLAENEHLRQLPFKVEYNTWASTATGKILVEGNSLIAVASG